MCRNAQRRVGILALLQADRYRQLMDHFAPTYLSSETYERRIIYREGAGATALIRQRNRARISSLTVPQPSLIVVVKGRKMVQWHDGDLTVGPGQAILLREGRFDIVNQPDTEHLYEALWLTWPTETLARFMDIQGSHPPANALEPEPPMWDALQRARRALADQSLPDAIASHRVEEILWWLRDHGIGLGRPITISFASRLRALIAENPGYGWSLAAAAGRLAVSSSTLRRNLKREGASFTDILADVRMSSALSLLQCTDAPVNRIALEIGYESPSRFAVRFRRRFGFSPAAVRRSPAPDPREK